MKNLVLILICVAMVIVCSGCSAILSAKFDGKNWSFGISGEAPEIPFVDYEVDLIK